MANTARSPEQARSLQRVRELLEELGYVGELMEPEYRFGDWFTPEAPERSVEAAAFGRTPIGFDTACFAVVASNGEAGVDRIRACRALGAPRAFEVDQRGNVFHWRVGVSPAEADRQQRFTPDSLDAAFRRHRNDWSPDVVLHAKQDGPGAARQLDFIDLGLIPAIEQNVREKIDPLLRDTLAAARRAATSKADRPPSWAGLFQLVFRALTGKIMHDRGIAPFSKRRGVPEAKEFLDRVAAHYSEREPVAVSDPDVQRAVLARLWAGVNLRNISVETLAYVWENTLLTDQARRAGGIHATPPSVARYILRRLPLTAEIALHGEVVEPCCGAATFLVAAMQRMRELLPRTMDGAARHKLFKKNLRGFDHEPFGLEVAKCRLMLADFPHPNKWGLYREDVFAGEDAAPRFYAALRRAAVVLCNPPFGAFNKGQRKKYPLTSVLKPVEMLSRVLDNIPAHSMIGFVLPLQAISGQSYRGVREKLAKRFGEIEVLSLPDRVFDIAEQETAVLIAHGEPAESYSTNLLHRKVDDGDWPAFRDRHVVTSESTATTNPTDAGASLALADLPAVWAFLADRPRLRDVTDAIRRGIEWNVPLEDNKPKLVANQPKAGFRKGIASAPRGRFLAYQSPPTAYLCVKPEYQLYKAFDLPWDRPKAVMSAKRKSRSPWRIAAFPDSSGLVCYQTFTSLWPAAGGWSAELLAAVLNSPVANAFVAAREGNRDITNEIVADIPVPALSAKTARFIVSRVAEYAATASDMPLMNPNRDAESRRLLLEIDAAVLKGYGLPPALERKLLGYFDGHEADRPVSPPVKDYSLSELNRVYAEIKDKLEPPGEGPSESWESLKAAIEESRASTRNLFP